jgi:hypothetical protein
MFCDIDPIKWTDNVTAIAAIGTMIVTTFLVIVGWSQLRKIRESNNLQALEALYNQYMSLSFVRKRKRLAQFVSNFEFGGQKGLSAIKSFFDVQNTSNIFNEDIPKIKNHFEDVIYLFQKIGYYSLTKKLFSLDDVYMLFSYEIQRYWILVESKIGYVSFLRNNNLNGENDFYKSFEEIFYKMIVYQIISQDNQMDCSQQNWYKCYSIEDIKINDKCRDEIGKIETELNVKEFLLEEINLNED